MKLMLSLSEMELLLTQGEVREIPRNKILQYNLTFKIGVI